MRFYKVNTHTRNGEHRWFIIAADNMADAIDMLSFVPQARAIRSCDGNCSIAVYGETTISCYYNDNKQGAAHQVRIGRGR